MRIPVPRPRGTALLELLAPGYGLIRNLATSSRIPSPNGLISLRRRTQDRRRRKAATEAGRRRSGEASRRRSKPLPEKAAPPDEPAVAAILATKPTTPEECVRAAKILADLGRADLAKGFLKKVLDAKLDQQQLADLGEQIGSPMFLDMSDRPALQPEAKQLADAVAAAVKARLEDTKRIAGLIQQLQDPSAEKRLAGAGGLAGSARRGHRSAAGGAGRSGPRRRTRQRAGGVGRDGPAWHRGRLVAIVEQADPKLAVAGRSRSSAP